MAEANSAQQAIRDGRRVVRELVHQYPEAKARTKEATNSDAWGPTSEQKIELVKIANNHSDDRELVYRALFKRLDPTSEYWMHSSKAMEVLEYFLILEVPDIVPRLHQNRETLTQLTGYHSAKHEDPVRQSQLNTSVKLKATRLLRMMDEPAYFAEEAQKVLTMMTRLGGSSAVTMPVAAAPGVKRSAETSPAPQAVAIAPASRAVPRGSGHMPDVYHEEEEAVPPAGRRSERAAFVDHEKSPTPPRHAVETAAVYHVPQESTRPSLFATAGPAVHHAPGYVPQNPPSPQPQSASPPQSSPPGASGATVDLFAQPPQQTVPHFQQPITTQPAATPAAFFAAPAPVATKQQPAPFPVDIFGPSPPTAAAPAPVVAPAPASRGAPPPAFDPFAEVTQAMRDEEQRKQRPQQPSNSTDFFGGGAAPAARPVEFVPTPQAQSTQGSSRASPAPQGPTGDRMTDYMFSQLAGLTSGKQAPKGETQSLEALLHNRPAH